MVLEDSVFGEQSKDQLDSLSSLFLPPHPVLTESTWEQMTDSVAIFQSKNTIIHLILHPHHWL